MKPIEVVLLLIVCLLGALAHANAQEPPALPVVHDIEPGEVLELPGHVVTCVVPLPRMLMPMREEPPAYNDADEALERIRATVERKKAETVEPME